MDMGSMHIIQIIKLMQFGRDEKWPGPATTAL